MTPALPKLQSLLVRSQRCPSFFFGGRGGGGGGGEGPDSSEVGSANGVTTLSYSTWHASFVVKAQPPLGAPKFCESAHHASGS